MNKTLALRLNLSLATLGGLLTLWVFLREPSEAQVAILLGFSLPRLLILGVIAFILSMGAVLFYRSLRRDFWASQMGEMLHSAFTGDWLPMLLLVVFLMLYFALFMTEQKLGDLASYRARLYPLLVWLEVLVIQLLVTALLGRARGSAFLHLYRDILLKTLLVFGALGLLVLFIAVSKVGLTPDAVYWQEAGVPLLIEQVLLAWGVGVGGYLLAKKQYFAQGLAVNKVSKAPFQDVLIGTAIWGIAFIVWGIYPLKPSYISLARVAPNFQSYPFGDALIFDINAQNYLIGIPIPNDFWQKPFYSFFLVILHLLGGQNYDLIVWFQVGMFAFIPVLAYLLTRTISHRPAGVIIALLLIFRERNAYALSNVIQVSHARFLMSDVLAMGLMVTLMFLLVLWLKNPEKHRVLPMFIGGTLGIFVLTRGHALLLFPFILLASAIVMLPHRRYKRFIEGGVMMLVGLVILLSAWIWRNHQWTGRWGFQDPVSPYTTQMARLYSLTPLENPARLPGETDEAYYNRIKGQPVQFLLHHPLEVMRFVSAHYAHNMIYSFIYLPASFRVEGAVPYVERSPFWKNWDGRLPDETRVLWLLNLLTLALGLSVVWNKAGSLAFVPLLMGIGYNLSVSMGRLSGWRLIMPADWITLIFYSAGLMEIAILLHSFFGQEQDASSMVNLQTTVAKVGKDNLRGSSQPLERSGVKWKYLVLVGCCFFFVSGGLINGHKLFPVRYPPKDSEEILQDYQNLAGEQSWSLTVTDLQKFLASEDAVALYGRGLYPSYLSARGGELNYFYLAFAPRPYKRLAFQLIGPEEIGVVLPLSSSPTFFPNAADVMVFGCRVGNEYTSTLPGYIDALAVIVKAEQPVLYLRNPLHTLGCPFPPLAVE
ncbi:MAG: hypothetical protein Fur0043_18460 [Anaerolineales bacterium]